MVVDIRALAAVITCSVTSSGVLALQTSWTAGWRDSVHAGVLEVLNILDNVWQSGCRDIT